MPSHGDNDSNTMRWYCSYWMTKEEWLDIHDYAPTDIVLKQELEQQ